MFEWVFVAFGFRLFVCVCVRANCDVIHMQRDVIVHILDSLVLLLLFVAALVQGVFFFFARLSLALSLLALYSCENDASTCNKVDQKCRLFEPANGLNSCQSAQMLLHLKHLFVCPCSLFSLSLLLHLSYCIAIILYR